MPSEIVYIITYDLHSVICGIKGMKLNYISLAFLDYKLYQKAIKSINNDDCAFNMQTSSMEILGEDDSWIFD